MNADEIQEPNRKGFRSRERSKTMHYAPDGCLRGAEIDQQTDVQPGSFQVVQALRGMSFVQRFDSLYLHNYASLDNEIGDEITDENILVTDLHPLLLGGIEADLA